MEINHIMSRFAEGLKYVDTNTNHVSANRRTGEVYLPGVKTMSERQFVKELCDWWSLNYPEDFNPRSALKREVPYENLSRASCDMQLSSDGQPGGKPEWEIEVKHIALVGNNGKNNDFGVAKILSPYLKDRSLIHDIHRMRKHSKATKKAVIGYCFSYSENTCNEARRRHPDHADFVDNIEEVCNSNDPVGKQYSVLEMVQFADEIFQQRNLVKNLNTLEFRDAWRHPCGGNGLIFGWEVNSSQN
ncbi:MAG: hypothetical protein EBY87_01565 [Actinobacteria bacterium]|nr:hypothetical protein [Actinomycetota bacterium]